MEREKKANRKYPQFAFRASETQKKTLQKRVTAIYARWRDSTPDDEKIINKNDIILEALDIGLAQLEKRKG